MEGSRAGILEAPAASASPTAISLSYVTADHSPPSIRVAHGGVQLCARTGSPSFNIRACFTFLLMASSGSLSSLTSFFQIQIGSAEWVAFAGILKRPAGLSARGK